jgi:hypothetical protein
VKCASNLIAGGAWWIVAAFGECELQGLWYFVGTLILLFCLTLMIFSP